MSPSRAIRRSSHLLHSASAHFGIIIFTLPGRSGTRHHPWQHTQPCHILLRYPGTTYLRLPRPSPLASIRHQLSPPMGRAHYRPDGARRRTSGELAARAEKKARREQEAAAAAAAAAAEAHPAAPPEEAEPDLGDDDEVEEAEAEIEEEEVEVEVEESPAYHRPRVRLLPAPKWGAVGPDPGDHAGSRARGRDRSRSPRRVTVSSERLFRLSKALTRLLRHKAAEEGLPLREDGFFEVGAIVRTRDMGPELKRFFTPFGRMLSSATR